MTPFHWTRPRPREAPNRRVVLRGLAAACALFPGRPTVAADPSPEILHALPYRAGRADGAAWEHATSFLQSGQVGANARPWQAVQFGVPVAKRPFHWNSQQIQWNSGGEDGNPVDLAFGVVSDDHGFVVSRDPADAPLFTMTGNELITGKRPDVGGAPFIVLGPKSSHLRIMGPTLDRAGGTGFFRLDADGVLRDLTFTNIHARNVGRAIECARGTAIDGLMVERCTARGLVRGFARFHALREAEFRDLDLDANYLDGGGGAVCQVISVVAGTDLTFRNIRLAKAVNSLAAEERGSPYIQGDGLVLEQDTGDVRIENCHAEDMGDGGFDLKSRGVQMYDCSATRCKLGIRIWSHDPANVIERCVVTEPTKKPVNDGACLWLAGTLTAQECHLAATQDMSPIRFGKGQNGREDARLKIKGGEIIMTDGVSLATGAAGLIELENVSVNGMDTSGRFRWTGSRLQRA